MALTWDHPDADPVGDVRAFLAELREHAHDPPPPLLLPQRLLDQWERERGRPFTLADLPPWTPGRWSGIQPY